MSNKQHRLQYVVIKINLDLPTATGKSFLSKENYYE